MLAKVIKFPGWRYGPNDEAAIYEREEDVPEGHFETVAEAKEFAATKSEPKELAPASPTGKEPKAPRSPKPATKRVDATEARRQELLAEAREHWKDTPDDATILELEAALAKLTAAGATDGDGS